MCSERKRQHRSHSPQHLCFSLRLSMPALFVSVNIAVKLGNGPVCFSSCGLYCRDGGGEGRGLLLFDVSICLPVQKQELWENGDGEALSQLPLFSFSPPCWGCCWRLLWHSPRPVWTLWQPHTFTDMLSNWECDPTSTANILPVPLVTQTFR